MNKLIVVTGGTKGIGLAIIHKFASSGFDVVTCSRNESQLKSLKTEIETTYSGVNLFIYTADVAQKDQVMAFGDFILRLKRPVDVLVNNAGYFVPGEIHVEKDGVLESMINSNLYSAYHLSRSLVGSMKQRKQGHIFNICSIASIMAYPNGGSYSITKYAMLGFSKCLREELKSHGIRVTAILPGATLTASWEGADLPNDRLMPPEDIALMIFSSYSLSPRSVVEDIIIRPQLGDL